VEPLSPEQHRYYVESLATLLGHERSDVRARGTQLLGALLRMARFTAAPNIVFPAFARPEAAP
jgi:hypothetical protein